MESKTLTIDGVGRTYLVNRPENFDGSTVLIFHGLGSDAWQQATWCDYHALSNSCVIYPQGAKIYGLRGWNDAATKRPGQECDFVRAILAAEGANPRATYAAGMSMGAMFCYVLAAHFPQLFCAISPVAGTVSVTPKFAMPAVSVLHFHGTADALCPYYGGSSWSGTFPAVATVMSQWSSANGCNFPRVDTDLPNTRNDGTTAMRRLWGGGRGDAEVELITINSGGHQWPGRPAAPLLGLSSQDIDANALMRDFFQKHKR